VKKKEKTWNQKVVFIIMQWKMVDGFLWLFVGVWFYLEYEKRKEKNSY
jgi:hypothetical protein